MVAMSASALSFERAPSAATARRARKDAAVGEPELGDALARGPMRDRRRDALNPEPVAERRERADDIVVERHMGERPVVFGPKLRCGRRTASRTSPSMIAIETMACAFGSIASQAPMRSSRRRGPSAIATVRSGGRARAGRGRRIDDGDRNAAPHRLLDRGRERQAGSARAGDDDVEDGSGFRHEAFP